MNTRAIHSPNLSMLTLGALLALSLMLAACGEQSGDQQSSTPAPEQSSESTTTTE